MGVGEPFLIIYKESELSPVEIDLVNKRLFNAKSATLQEIAKKHGITRERVRIIEKKLIHRLKDSFKEEFID